MQGFDLLTQNFSTVEGGGAVPAMLSLQVGGSFHAAVKPLYPSVFTIVAIISQEPNAIITPITVLVIAFLPVSIICGFPCEANKKMPPMRSATTARGRIKSNNMKSTMFFAPV